jgi:hypothetical protein
MKINKEYLERLLIRGLDIPYMGVKVKQPTVKDLDEIFLDYDSYKFIYSASKDFIQFEEGESIDDYKDYTYFQTLFKLKNKIYFQTLILSIEFFLKVKIANDNIRVSNDMKIIIVDDEGKNILFTLDNNNFEEFSELIRLVCCCEKMKVEDKNKQKIRKYKDTAMQQKYETLMIQLKKNEEKKNRENGLTISDVIGAICINENTKYNFKNIEELTIWQLFYQFNSMFTKENIEIVKSQFTSGNYNFEKVPDMDWLKKVKVKLPESTKLTE